MKRIIGSSLLALVGLVALPTTSARAEKPTGDPDLTTTGVEVGLRSGFSVPFGKDIDTDRTPGQVPIALDLGYRITPSLFVGGYFQYGFALIKGSTTCDRDDVSCKLRDIQFGAQIHYHGAPEKTLDPWVGFGIGYEILHSSTTVGDNDLSVDAKGFQFAKFQLGADYRLSESFAIGPFIDFSINMFNVVSFGDASGDIDSPKPHEWFTFGLRGVFDIAVGGSKDYDHKASQKERDSTTNTPDTAESAPPPASNSTLPPASSSNPPPSTPAPPQKGVTSGEAGAWPPGVPIADRGTCSFVCVATDGASPREADKVALTKALEKHLGALRACVAPNGGKSANAVIVSFNPGGNATVNYSFEQRAKPRADCPGSLPPVRGVSGPPNSTWKCTDYCE